MHGGNIQKNYLKCQPVETTQSVHCAVPKSELQELCGCTGCSECVWGGITLQPLPFWASSEQPESSLLSN